MSEPGDNLERRYRDLARDEPPPSVDAAILDASRRAVRRPSASRWAAPVAVAAVLVLALGVTLRMQQEEPGIETSIPQGAPPPAAPETPAPAAPVAPAPAVPETAPAPAPPPQVKIERKDERQREQRQKLAAPPRQPPVEKPAATQSAPLAFPAQENAAPAVPAPVAPAPAAPAAIAPSAPPAPAASSAPAARAAPSADALQAPAAAGSAAKRMAPMSAPPRAAEERAIEQRAVAEPERELERIARLRAEGRDAEADKALEEFRRRFPGYRIEPAMWERVRPREAR